MRGYLDPGERVRLESRLHGVALAAPLARASLLAAAGALIVALGSPAAAPLGVLGAVAIGVAAALALSAVARWDRTTVVLTTEKLLVLYGILKRRGATVELDHSGPIEVEQDLLGRLLGYGTVIAGDLEIPYVPEAAWLLAVPEPG
jgi:uncharacterized membrane protein YdbT with pleckstrin-like domain